MRISVNNFETTMHAYWNWTMNRIGHKLVGVKLPMLGCEITDEQRKEETRMSHVIMD